MRTRDSNEMKIVHAHAGFWEPLEGDPTFLLRPMFGTKAVYLHGKIVLCFSTREEPWRGVLVATERAHHASLLAEIPSLSAHPILPKWLYVPESSARFESTVERLVQLVRNQDPRIGVVPRAKKKGRSKKFKVTRIVADQVRMGPAPAQKRKPKNDGGIGARRPPRHAGKRRPYKSKTSRK